MKSRGRGGRPADPGRISAWQLALLITSILAVEDSTTLDHWLSWRVGIDAWSAILVALPIALLGVWMLFGLADRYPDRDLVEILRRTVGPLAYPLGVLCAALFLTDAVLSLREFGTLAQLLSFMNLTPYWVFAAGLAGVALYGGWLGIEVLARVNAATFLFVEVPFGILLTLFSMNHQRYDRLLPVLVHGVRPVLWGAWLVIGQFGDLLLLLVFLPLVTEGRGHARRVGVWTVLLVALIMLGHSVGPALTFGSSVRKVQWPLYSQIRSVVLARFIANLDWWAVILWTHGFLIEVSLFVYAAALTLAKLFGARSHRPFLPALGGAVFVASLFIWRTQPAMLFQRWRLAAYGFTALGWGLPLLLFAVSLLRGQGTRRPALRRALRRSPPVVDPPAARRWSDTERLG